jgi:hypothetical protein
MMDSCAKNRIESYHALKISPESAGLKHPQSRSSFCPDQKRFMSQYRLRRYNAPQIFRETTMAATAMLVGGTASAMRAPHRFSRGKSDDRF